MPTFTYQVLTNAPLARIETTALGTGGANIYGDEDIGKPMKRSAAGTMVICAKDDEIEGFLNSIEPGTVNAGYSWGGVQFDRRVQATVGASQSGAIALFTHVVADTQVAIGTSGIAEVYAGTAASQAGADPFAYTERTPNTHIWRVIAHVTGTGVTGDTVLLEKI